MEALSLTLLSYIPYSQDSKKADTNGYPDLEPSGNPRSGDPADPWHGAGHRLDRDKVGEVSRLSLTLPAASGPLVFICLPQSIKHIGLA